MVKLYVIFLLVSLEGEHSLGTVTLGWPLNWPSWTYSWTDAALFTHWAVMTYPHDVEHPPATSMFPPGAPFA
jgi:hypothetical protein